MRVHWLDLDRPIGNQEDHLGHRKRDQRKREPIDHGAASSFRHCHRHLEFRRDHGHSKPSRPD